MTELLAHLFGDYVLQSHVMATRKTSSWRWALIHATFYTLPFLLLTQEPWALAVIGGTHAVIDRYRLAAKWCALYGVGMPGIWWRLVHGWWSLWDEGVHYELDLSPEPVFEPPPPFLGVWLVIIVDNSFHLLINHLALRGAL